MKKGIKIILATLVMTTIISVGGIAYANAGYGSAGALVDTEYTVEEMLIYAIQDEYAAQASYEAVTKEYGEQAPFTNILRAEENHINRLTQLFTNYGYALPSKEVEVILEDSLDKIYVAEAALEKSNIAMYDKFLEEELPEDVKLVFEQLRRASERHLKAFENAAEGNLVCDGTGSMRRGDGTCNENANCTGNGKGMGRGKGLGRGQNNRSSRMKNTL